MPTLNTLLLALLWPAALWWCLASSYALLNLLLMPRLPRRSRGGKVPRLSVVIPARDEERSVEGAVVSHCSQDCPGLEVIVVDDGSTDGTAEILARLAGRFGNLRALRCGDPPPGWMGKTNAQRRGLEEASGEFVLLADADVVYGPGTHRRALEEMVRRDLDLLLFIPRQRGETFGETLVVSFLDAFSTYAVPTFLANVPALRRVAFGTGAGNLVRRAALEAIGGIGAVGGQVVEDVELGRRIKGLRGRTRAVVAYREIHLRMYHGFGEAVEGFTKNLYSALGRSPLRAVAGHLCDLWFHLLPAACLPAVLLAPALAAARLPALLAVGLGVLCNAVVALWGRHPLWLALAFPLRSPVWAWICIRSARQVHGGGIRWRGRVYGGRE